ncbi:MAG: hypothetical protein R3D45_16410 [Rhizobiaceae bacterium]
MKHYEYLLELSERKSNWVAYNLTCRSIVSLFGDSRKVDEIDARYIYLFLIASKYWKNELKKDFDVESFSRCIFMYNNILENEYSFDGDLKTLAHLVWTLFPQERWVKDFNVMDWVDEVVEPFLEYYKIDYDLFYEYILINSSNLE